MADSTPSSKIVLPAEITDRLKNMEDQISQAEQGTAAMKKLGLDTSDIDDKITWAKEVRETLLREFS